MDQPNQPVQPNILQEPPQPQPSLQPEIPKKPGLPIWLIILIIVTAVIVLGAGSYATYRYFTPQPEPAELSTTGEGEPTEEPADETANWQTYRNEEYGFEIQLPAEWMAYSGYDGSVIASSPASFPENPLILTGTRPDLNFQIAVIENITVNKYRSSFLDDAQQLAELQIKSGQTGVKLIRGEDAFFIIQINKNLLKIYSSNSEYISNDRIFTSIEFIE